MQTKKFLKNILVLSLALIMAFGSSVNALAASSNYVSDVVTYVADSYEEAEAGLAELGYTIVKNSNLNSTLETGVYLGYKTTTNKDEAITDIAAMNMNGSYSYTDYENILNDKRDEIMTQLEKIMPAISAFQDSYNEGKVSGKLVYAALNQYLEDDSGKLMGDILLEYDSSDEKKAELTEMLLQGSSVVVLSIIQTLALTAGNCDGTSIVDNMKNYGLEGVYKQYLKDNKNNAVKATRAINADLSERVIAIQNEWDNLYNILCEAEKYIVVDGEDITINLPEVEEDIDNTTIASVLEETNLYLKLRSTVIDKDTNMTALEYFKRPFDNSYIDELYLFAYVLTEAQAGLLTYVSLAKLLEMDSYVLDTGSEEAEEVLETFEEDGEAFVSLYDGIDRTYFEDGVAFTSEATKHESLTGESWSPAGSGINWLAAIIATSALSVVCAGVGAGVLAYARSVRHAQFYDDIYFAIDWHTQCGHRLYYAKQALRRSQEELSETLAKIELYNKNGKTVPQSLYRTVESSKTNIQNAYRQIEQAEANVARSSERLDNAYNAYKNGVSKAMKAVSYVMFALAIVCLILDISSIVAYFVTNEVEEENIPVHLVTALEDGDGKTDYVYYNTVNDLAGIPGDLNNHEGEKSVGWLVLYYTKDPLAGDPITVDKLSVQTGSNTVDENMYGIHMFNEEAPANLTAEKYTSVSDSANGTYVLFERANPLAVGSAISQGQSIIYLVIGFAVGALGSVLIIKKGSREKEQVA